MVVVKMPNIIFKEEVSSETQRDMLALEHIGESSMILSKKE